MAEQKIKQDEIRIGENIRQARREKGIGQTELVRLLQLRGIPITRESLGIPVIAIGVPTVVDAATIVGDAIESMIRENGEKNTLFRREHPKAISELNNMYVTSKDIDETVKRLSFTISEAINIALQIA